MKSVQTHTRVYYHGTCFIPFLDNPKYGKFPLSEDKDTMFYDKVPVEYAKSLVEGTPNMFSLTKEVVTGYDQYDEDNLRTYAKDRGISQAKNMKKENIISKLIELDKEETPEEKADALK